MFLLLVMELWRLRAREFLSARSTHDSREEESLAEALSSPNSAPINWRHRDRDRGETTLSERWWSAEEKPLTCPFVSVCHLFVLQGDLGFDSQDQIRCGIPQLADVRVDVPLQPHIVVHVPVRRGEIWWWGKTQSKSVVDASWHYFLSNPEVITETGALRQVISRMA